MAELARRGLLLLARLPVVTPIIQPCAMTSVAGRIASALTAAYVCWACARAYEPHLLEDSVAVLSSSLLVVAMTVRSTAGGRLQQHFRWDGVAAHLVICLPVLQIFRVLWRLFHCLIAGAQNTLIYSVVQEAVGRLGNFP